jgi:MoaA/NifB/PqqE/SkfB family radical SAM enzyme
MCDIWKRNPKDEFTLNDLEKFLKKNIFPKLNNVSISGGEPALRKDIVELVKLFNSYYEVGFILQSNCFATKRVVDVAKKISKFADLTVCCSLDGIGETHEKIRGVPDAYNKVMKTMEMLYKNKINFLVSMTIQPENQHQIKDVYSIANKFGKSFWCRPAGSGHFFSKGNKNELDVNLIIKQFKEINYAGHNWLKMVELYLKKGEFPYNCTAGFNSFVITPNFDVFPCSHCPLSWKLGNLKEEGYDIEKLISRNDKSKTCHACINEIAHPIIIPKWRSKLWTIQRFLSL